MFEMVEQKIDFHAWISENVIAELCVSEGIKQ